MFRFTWRTRYIEVIFLNLQHKIQITDTSGIGFKTDNLLKTIGKLIFLTFGVCLLFLSACILYSRPAPQSLNVIRHNFTVTLIFYEDRTKPLDYL